MKHFAPVTIKYNKIMLPYFEAAKNEMEQDGYLFDGLSWKIEGDRFVVTITREQQESYLLALGIKVGKLIAKQPAGIN